MRFDGVSYKDYWGRRYDTKIEAENANWRIENDKEVGDKKIEIKEVNNGNVTPLNERTITDETQKSNWHLCRGIGPIVCFFGIGIIAVTLYLIEN